MCTTPLQRTIAERDIRDTKLLSFGADADEDAEGASTVVKKKSVARPDCE